jgi:hypothetical protein
MAICSNNLTSSHSIAVPANSTTVTSEQIVKGVLLLLFIVVGRLHNTSGFIWANVEFKVALAKVLSSLQAISNSKVAMMMMREKCEQQVGDCCWSGHFYLK